MRGKWIDFNILKKQVSMKMVLDCYGIDWLRTGNGELRGRCPIHKGDGLSSFHASLTKNVFHCFSCGACGNVLNFVAQMEKCSLPSAAQKLKTWFAVSGQAACRHLLQEPTIATAWAKTSGENELLGFDLKGIDHAHPYLIGRGLDRQTAETFGVGFYRGRGWMSGRIVIPIHNSRGQLVAYAGRSVTGAEPKYLFPRGFRKSYELYNVHRVIGTEVVLVEGFFDCMKASQSVHVPAVALMGCSLSWRQEQTMVSRFRKATLLLDGDTAGREAGEKIAARLARKIRVRIIRLQDGGQPDQLSQEEFRTILSL